MNELTLVRFIEAMKLNEMNPTNKLYIDLMAEEVEGFLEYPRLLAYFEKTTPIALKQLQDALANQAELTLNTTPFKALVAVDPNGTIAIPQKVLFFYIDGDAIGLDVVDWLNMEPVVETFYAGSLNEAWVAGNHLSYPYEEIKSPYLYPLYLDDVVPGKSAHLTKLLASLTIEVLESSAGKAWCDQAKMESHWEQMGYKKYKK